MKQSSTQRKDHSNPSLLSGPRLKQSQITVLTSRPFAHRGLHGFFNPSTYQKYPDTPPLHKPFFFIPENTLASFQLAIQNQLAIELDLHYTKDHRLVIFHDNNTFRLTQISQKIKHSTLADIQKLQLLSPSQKSKNPFSKKYTSQIPTLESALQLIAGKTPLLIELKSEFNVNYRRFCQQTADLLQKYQEQCQNAPVAIKSFDPRIVNWFLRYSPKVPSGLLISSHPKPLYYLGLSLLKFPFNLWFKPDFLSVDKKIIQHISIQNYRRSHPILCWVLSSGTEDHYQKYTDNYIIE